MSEQFPRLPVPSVVDAKREGLSIASEVKRAKLASSTPQGDVDAMLRARIARLERASVASASRNAGELIQDSAASVARFANSVLGGGAMSGLAALGDDSLVGDTLRTVLPGANLLPGAVVNAAADGSFDALATGSRAADAAMAGSMSEISQLNEQIVGERIQAQAEENRIRQQQELDAGASTTAAGLRRWARDVRAGAAETLANPTYLSNQVIGQAPTLLMGPAANAAARLAVPARAGASAARTAAVRAGVMTPAFDAAATQAASAELRAAAAKQFLTAGTMAMESSAAYGQVASEIMGTKIEVLAQQYPAVAEQLAQGIPEAEIKRGLAQELAGVTAAVVAPVAGAAARLTTGFELNPTGSALNRGQRLAAGAGAIGGELLEEGVQSGSAELVGNAVSHYVGGNEEQDLLDGVGVATGQGAATGAVFSGALRAPGMAADAAAALVPAAAKAAWSATKTAFAPVLAYGEKRMKEAQADAAKQSEENQAHLAGTADLVAQTAVDLPAEIQESLAPNVEATAALPEKVQGLVLEDGNKLATLSRLVGAVNAGEVAAEDMQVTQLHILRTALELGRTRRQLATAVEAEQDPEQQDRLATVERAILQATENPLVQDLMTTAKQVPVEQLAQVFENLPNVTIPEGQTLDPKIQSSLELVKTIAHTMPDRVPVQAAQRALFQSARMKPEDVKQLQLSLDFGKLVERHEQKLEEVTKKYPRFKPSDVVRSDIVDTGFQVGSRHLKSVSQHVRSISEAMSMGRVQEAKMALQEFSRFAQHMGNKATNFDKVATDQALNNLDEWQTTEFNTIGADGKPAKNKARLNIKVEGSRGLIDAVFVDANTVIEAYNQMTRAYPDLLGLDPTLQAEMTLPGEPSWTKATPAPAVAEEAPAAVEVAPEETTADPDAAAREAELAQAQAALAGDRSSLAVDFESEAKASQEELDRALDMTAEAYIQEINPEQLETIPEAAEVLADMSDETVPERAVVVREENGITLKADGNVLYALRGDELVGKLAVSAKGTELGVSKQKEGIGTLLMRELLVRNPFAPAGELSEGAKRTRLRVLEQLRAERNANRMPTTVAERFPGLADVPVTEGETVAEQAKGLNKLLHSFKLKANGRGLFARMRDPVTKVREAALQGMAALQDLYLPQHQHTELTDEQRAALVELLDKVPLVVEQLNKNLQHAGESNWLKRFLTNPAKEWSYSNRGSLHATVNVDGKLQYQPELAQAMALAGLHWVIDNINNPVRFDREKVARLFPDGRIPTRLLPHFQTKHYFEQPARNLARELMELTGLQGLNTASVTDTDGVPKALAADVINALAGAGLVTLDKQAGTKTNARGGYADFTFLEFDKAKNSLKDLRQRLGKTSALTRLLYPEGQHLPTLGKPPVVASDRVQGTTQRLSAEQREITEQHNRIEYRLNKSMGELLGKLGRDSLLRLLGHSGKDQQQLQALNQEHRLSVEGTDRGLERSLDAAVELTGLIGDYAAAEKIDDAEVPVHFSHVLLSNGRMMMQGRGPQSDTLLRELLVPYKAVLNLSNEEHVLAYHLTLAQALGDLFGLKVEQVPNSQAMAMVKAFLAQDQVQEIMLDMDFLMTGEPEDQDSFGRQLVDKVQALGVTKPREFHALWSYMQFQKLPKDATEFETHLAFELDGKTDGPINAMVHFGLHAFDEKMHRQLMQGGVLLNEQDQLTLNERGKGLGDIYGAVAGQLRERIQNLLAQTSGVARNQIRASLVRLEKHGKLKHTSDPGSGASVYDGTRNIAKHGVTAKVYGSGSRAVVEELASEIVMGFYEEMSEAIANDMPLPATTQNAIKALMGVLQIKGQLVEVPLFADKGDLAKVSSYRNLKFSDAALAALTENLMAGVGGELTQAIDTEMAPIMDTFSLIIRASSVQAVVARQAFVQAYEAKRKELVDGGVLLPNQALSRQDEQAVLDSIKHLLPVYGLMTTSEGTLDEGLSIAQKDFSGRFQVGERPEQTASIAGNLAMDINATQLLDPGVRAAALITIASGDGVMMAQMFRQLRRMLNVYDGLEVAADELFGAAREVNQAVLNGYQFDVLGQVQASFARTAIDVEALPTKDVIALARVLRLNVKELTEAQVYSAVKAELGDLRTALATRASTVKATKDVLFGGTVSVAIDHMAGGQRPARIEAETVPDLVTLVNTEVAKRVAKDRSPLSGNDPALQERLGKIAENGLATLDREELRLLLQTMRFPNKLHFFVYKTIEHLLPRNLTVYVGNPDVIAAKQAELFPGQDLGGPQELGVYYRDTLFLKTASMETLLHELVHATTYGLVQAHYRGDAKLSFEQVAAINELETLARNFVQVTQETEDESVADAMEMAQRTVRDYLAQGDLAEAVNEFLAWSLTNRQVAQALQRQQAPSGLIRLARRAISAIRKLLRLPNNTNVVSFLESTLGHFRALAQATREHIPPMDGTALFQSLAGPSDRAHAVHLADVQRQMAPLLESLPRSELTGQRLLTLTKAYRFAVQTMESFRDAGFQFSDQERLVFEQVQAVFASGIQLDPQAVSTMQSLYAAAIKELEVEDFMDNPESTDPVDRSMAQRRYDAVLGLGNTRRMDSLGRSNLLPNFVALAMVHPPMRRKLANLTLPAAPAQAPGLDGKLRHLMTRVFDKLGNVSQHISANSSQQQALDLLVARLSQTHQTMVKRSRQPVGAVAEAENWTKQQLAKVGDKAEALRQRRSTQGQLGRVDGFINLMLGGVRDMTNENGDKVFGETAISLLNTSNLPTFVRELGGELIGATDHNQAVVRLLTQAKHIVARVRQRLRDEVPDQVLAMFTKPLSAQVLSQLFTAVGKTDLQVLKATFNAPRLLAIFEDAQALATEIATLEDQLQERPEWAEAARNLGGYLVTGLQSPDQPMLYRNATAMSLLAGHRRQVNPARAKEVEPLLDQLITLRAVEALPVEQKQTVAELLRTEKDGMGGLLNMMRHLQRAERGKPNADRQQLNRWKGYVPRSWDPRNELVLATADKGRELTKLGYRLVSYYHGDPNDPAGTNLAYYAQTIVGGRATYNQGALQTVEGSISGVDHLMGRTLDPAVSTMIQDPGTVRDITRLKQRGRGGALGLLPIFDEGGNVVAYERPLDPALIETHLTGKKDLAKSIGMWMGRQAEEAFAQQFNRNVVKELHKIWEQGQQENREGEFVNIARAETTVQKDVWNTIPRDTQDMLREVFDDRVMVRKDMLNNALGYRSASVADVFTGMGNLPNDVRETLVKVAFALHPSAYKWLVGGERLMQSLVGSAKDWIVVRSGVVAVANGLSNQFQLLMHGVPLKYLMQSQARKVVEVETYLRNEARIAKIQVELAATTRHDVKRTLERELQTLNDANARLSIWPLVEAGELPTIAEGLTEQDEYSLLADGLAWVEKKTAQLPKGLTTVGRYAFIAKDTALYQGLNRMIQFGDFMAKATLYDHLLSQGKSQADALRIVNERFVNYNLLAGRSRDYLESMGLTWFMNYKLRIQKVVLSTLRENPLRFLMAGVGADWLGADSLISASAPNAHWGYALGPGQMYRAHEMNAWMQLFD